nr:hypothetical protein [Tanacetum cinerariifolium]
MSFFTPDIDGTPARANPYELGNRLPGLMEIIRYLQLGNTFWQNAVQAGGRPEISQALRAAAEGICAMQRKLSEIINAVWLTFGVKLEAATDLPKVQ